MIDPGTLSVLKVYRTPRKFAFVPVHWSFDPEKTPEWAEREFAKYSRAEDYAREQELDFSVHLGALAYPAFRLETHVFPDDQIPYEPRLPLDLWCDFNASPQAWGVSQVVGGWINVIDEIFRDPSTVEGGVDQFREMYPDHRAEVRVFGDASVKTFYDTMRLSFRGYSSPVVFKVPIKNPRVLDRLNSVDAKLRAKDGRPGVRIRRRCVNLIQDFQECVLRPDQKDLLKVTDARDPFQKRTHMSDAFGYMVHREWPILTEAVKLMSKRREARPVGKPIGEIHYKGRR